MSKFNRNLLDEMNELFNEWYDDVVPDESDDQEIRDAINTIFKERDDEFARAKNQLGLDGDDLLRHHIQWYKDKIKKHKQRISTKGVDLDDMIMDLEDKIRNPRGPTRKNPWDEAAIEKKRQEAIDRLGGEDKFQKAVKKAGQEYDKAWYEFWKISDEKQKELWDEQIEKTTDRYFNGEIDAIEDWQIKTQLFRDAIRQIKAERQVASVNLDDMIMDLEDKIRNPRRPPRKNPAAKKAQKRQEAVDRLGGEDEYTKADDEAYQEYRKALNEFDSMSDEKWKELWREQAAKIFDKYFGKIDAKYWKIKTRWLRDAIRQIKAEQDSILDDMIMDLESKVDDHR